MHFASDQCTQSSKNLAKGRRLQIPSDENISWNRYCSRYPCLPKRPVCQLLRHHACTPNNDCANNQGNEINVSNLLQSHAHRSKYQIGVTWPDYRIKHRHTECDTYRRVEPASAT